VCSDRAVRRGKEKAASNTDKKRCKEMEPTVAELKAAIEGRGVDLTTVLANVKENSDKVDKWKLFSAASRIRVMSKLMAKSGAYKEKIAQVKETTGERKRFVGRSNYHCRTRSAHH
jgi:fructosamine-3-kinase